MVMAEPAHPTLRHRFELVVKRLPNVQQRQEIRVRVGESPVRRVRLHLLVERPFARILNAEPGGDDQNLAHTFLRARLQDHAADRGIDRKAGEVPADRGQLPFLPRPNVRLVAGVANPGHRDRAELFQQLVAGPDRLGRRRVDKGKPLDVSETGHFHPQDDVGQIGALNLGLRETRPLEIVRLGKEPDADAFGHAAAAAFALVGAALRDRFDRQAPGPRLRRIAADARQAGVDHEADAGNRERRLGNVGGDDDLAVLGRGKDALLLSVAQAAEKRDDLGTSELSAINQVARFPDVALGRHEDQEVTGRTFPQDPFDGGHGAVDVVQGLRPRGRLVVGRGVGAEFVQGRIDHLNGIEPAGHLDDRRVIESLGKRLGVDRRRRDNRAQLRPAEAELAQVAEKKIDVERPLVRLVDDDRVVLAQQRIALQLGQQHAIGEVLDHRRRRRVVGETDLAADFAAPRHAELLRDATGDGQRRHAPRLRAGNPAGDAATRRQAHLGNLGGLARPGFAREHQHRMLLDGRRDVFDPRADGQLGRKIQAETGDTAVHGIDRQFPRPTQDDKGGESPGLPPACGRKHRLCGRERQRVVLRRTQRHSWHPARLRLLCAIWHHHGRRTTFCVA